VQRSAGRRIRETGRFLTRHTHARAFLDPCRDWVDRRVTPTLPRSKKAFRGSSKFSVSYLIGGPHGARTRDLLIANKTEGESQPAPEGLSPSPDEKKPEDETR